MEALKSKEEITTYWVQTCRGDKTKLQADLEALSFPKLSIVAKALSMKVAGDKKSIVKTLVDKIAKEDKKVRLAPLPAPEDDTGFSQIKINPDYVNLVPRPSQEDYDVLKNSIQKNGLQKKIEVLSDGTIVDGHTRYEALQTLGIFSPTDHTIVVDIAKGDIEKYVFDMNFARRQLSDYHKIVWVKKYLPKIKEKVKAEGDKKRSEALKKVTPEKPAKRTSTRKEEAKAAGVSEAQQKKFNFLEKYAPDMLQDIEKEEMTLGGAYDKAYGWYREIKAKDDDLFK